MAFDPPVRTYEYLLADIAKYVQIPVGSDAEFDDDVYEAMGEAIGELNTRNWKKLIRSSSITTPSTCGTGSSRWALTLVFQKRRWYPSSLVMKSLPSRCGVSFWMRACM